MPLMGWRVFYRALHVARDLQRNGHRMWHRVPGLIVRIERLWHWRVTPHGSGTSKRSSCTIATPNLCSTPRSRGGLHGNVEPATGWPSAGEFRRRSGAGMHGLTIAPTTSPPHGDHNRKADAE